MQLNLFESVIFIYFTLEMPSGGSGFVVYATEDVSCPEGLGEGSKAA